MTTTTQSLDTGNDKVRTNTSVASWTLSIAVISLVVSGVFPIFLKVSIASFAIFAIWLVGRCAYNLKYWDTRPQKLTKVATEWPKPARGKSVLKEIERKDDYNDYLIGLISSYGYKGNEHHNQ